MTTFDTTLDDRIAQRLAARAGQAAPSLGDPLDARISARLAAHATPAAPAPITAPPAPIDIGQPTDTGGYGQDFRDPITGAAADPGMAQAGDNFMQRFQPGAQPLTLAPQPAAPAVNPMAARLTGAPMNPADFAASQATLEQTAAAPLFQVVQPPPLPEPRPLGSEIEHAVGRGVNKMSNAGATLSNAIADRLERFGLDATHPIVHHLRQSASLAETPEDAPVSAAPWVGGIAAGAPSQIAENDPRKFLYGPANVGGEMLPAMAGGVAVSAATEGAGLPAYVSMMAGASPFAVQSAGEAYRQAKDAKLSDDRAAVAAIAHGALAEVLGMTHLGSITGKVPGLGQAVEDMALSRVQKYVTTEAAHATFNGAVGVAGTAVGDAIDITTKANPEAFKDFGQQAVSSAGAMGGMSLMGAPGRAVGAIRRVQAEKAQVRSSVDDLVAANPGKLRDIVQNATPEDLASTREAIGKAPVNKATRERIGNLIDAELRFRQAQAERDAAGATPSSPAEPPASPSTPSPSSPMAVDQAPPGAAQSEGSVTPRGSEGPGGTQTSAVRAGPSTKPSTDDLNAMAVKADGLRQMSEDPNTRVVVGGKDVTDEHRQRWNTEASAIQRRVDKAAPPVVDTTPSPAAQSGGSVNVNAPKPGNLAPHGTLYSEQSPDRAVRMLDPKGGGLGVGDDIWLSNRPEMAAGQGTNRGVKIEFDAGPLSGQERQSKPGSVIASASGSKEFVGRDRPEQYQQAARKVTISGDVIDNASTDFNPNPFAKRLVNHLRARGWTESEQDDGSIEFTRPPTQGAPHEPQAPAPQVRSEQDQAGRGATPPTPGEGGARAPQAAPPDRGADHAAGKEVEPKHDYSSTQIDLPPEVSDRVKAAAAKIPDADLASDGREANPHVTVKYGLHTDDPAKLIAMLKDQPPITVKLGDTSIFAAKETDAQRGGEQYDVVKADVDSPELHTLNKKIADAEPHTDTHPKYQPHVTLAYVKAGEGAKYVGDSSLRGTSVAVDRITFSGKDGKTTEIRLSGKPAKKSLRQKIDERKAGKESAASPPPQPTPEPPARVEDRAPQPQQAESQRAGQVDHGREGSGNSKPAPVSLEGKSIVALRSLAKAEHVNLTGFMGKPTREQIIQAITQQREAYKERDREHAEIRSKSSRMVGQQVHIDDLTAEVDGEKIYTYGQTGTVERIGQDGMAEVRIAPWSKGHPNKNPLAGKLARVDPVQLSPAEGGSTRELIESDPKAPEPAASQQSDTNTVSLPASVGGGEYTGVLPTWVRKGLRPSASHKQRKQAMEWVARKRDEQDTEPKVGDWVRAAPNGNVVIGRVRSISDNGHAPMLALDDAQGNPIANIYANTAAIIEEPAHAASATEGTDSPAPGGEEAASGDDAAGSGGGAGSADEPEHDKFGRPLAYSPNNLSPDYRPGFSPDSATGKPVLYKPLMVKRGRGKEVEATSLNPSDPGDAAAIIKAAGGDLRFADIASVEVVDAAYRTMLKPVGEPIIDAVTRSGDTTVEGTQSRAVFYAMPGHEKEVQAIRDKADRMGPQKIDKLATGLGAGRVTHEGGTGAKLPPTSSRMPKEFKSDADRIVGMHTAAAARENSRYAINGVAITDKGKTLVVTDGRRLYFHTKADGIWGKDGVYGVTKTGLGGTLEGSFPPYKDVIPSGEPILTIDSLDVERTLRDVRRAALLTNEESRGTYVVLNPGDSKSHTPPSLGFVSVAPETGESCINVQNGYRPLMAINPDFLADAMEWHRSNNHMAVKFEYRGANKPFVTSTKDWNFGPGPGAKSSKINGEFKTITMPVNASYTPEGHTSAEAGGGPPTRSIHTPEAIAALPDHATMTTRELTNEVKAYGENPKSVPSMLRDQVVRLRDEHSGDAEVASGPARITEQFLAQTTDRDRHIYKSTGKPTRDELLLMKNTAGLSEEQRARLEFLRDEIAKQSPLGSSKAMKPPGASPKAGAPAVADSGTVSRPRKTQTTEEAITDAGEKIGGARKDVWSARGMKAADLAGMTDREAYQKVTKDEAWPKPDYKAMIEGGVDPVAARLIKTMRDRMPLRPKDDPEARRRFLEAIDIVRDEIGKVKTPEDAKGLVTSIQRRFGWSATMMSPREWQQTEPAKQLFTLYKGRSSPFNLKWSDTNKAKLAVQGGWPNKEAATGDWFEVHPFGSEFVVTRRGKKMIIGRKHFATEAEARTWATENFNKVGSQKTNDPTRPQLTGLDRTGPDWREGKDVDAQGIINAFGFRGVEFGNWMTQADRQQSLNHAYDSLMDLAAAMGVPPGALSLNGELAAAFGARGIGGYPAHYESGRKVFNLTKMSGAGALAHEWAHAFDDYLGRISGVMGNAEPFASENPKKAGSQLRTELQEALGHVMSVISRRQQTQAEAIDEAKKKIDRYTSNLKGWLKAWAAEFEGGSRRDGEHPSPEQVQQFKVLAQQAADGVNGSAQIDALANLYHEGLGKIAPKDTRQGVLNNLAAVVTANERLAKIVAGEPGTLGKTDTDLLKASKKLDEAKSKDYWSTGRELFARTFESWVFDRLARDRSIQDHSASPYLVGGISEREAKSEMMWRGAYPSGVERSVIGAAFDDLVGAIKIKGRDSGGEERDSVAKPRSAVEERVAEVRKAQAGPADRPPQYAMGAAAGTSLIPGARLGQALAGLRHDAGIKATEALDAVKAAAIRVASRDTAPLVTKLSEPAGDAVTEFAAARIAAKPVAASIVADILPDSYKDKDALKEFGTLLAEERLRAIKKRRDAAGEDTSDVATLIGAAGSPFKTEAEYQTAWVKYADAVDRWVNGPQKTLTDIHKELGGKLDERGEHGTFVNMRTLDPTDPEARRENPGLGMARGNLRNPRLQRSAFAMRATGTGRAYEVRFDKLVEHAVNGNIVRLAKKRMVEALEEAGLAVRLTASQAREFNPDTFERWPTVNGRRAREIQNVQDWAYATEPPEPEEGTEGLGDEQKARAVQVKKSLFVDPRVYAEVRRVLNIDEATLANNALTRAVGSVITATQLVGPVDFTFHAGRIISQIARSQGGGPAPYDWARKGLPPLAAADALGRLVTNAVRVVRDSPEIRKQIAELARIGAMRAEQRPGGLGRAMGWVSENVPGMQWTLPLKGLFNLHLIPLLDKAGRLALDNMAKNLEGRGLINLTDRQRRNFSNQLGQYNSLLQTRLVGDLKESGLAPFITAGLSGNVEGIKAAAGSPVIKGKSPKARAQLWATEILGNLIGLALLPILLNLLTTGKAGGRDGVPLGAIDTGKDDADGKPIYYDPAKLSGVRRGLRATGIGAVAEGLRKDRPLADIQDDWLDQLRGAWVHPLAGPPVDIGAIAATGSDAAGKRVAVGQGPGPNLKAAAEHANPTVEAYIAGRHAGGSGLAAAGKQLGSAVGIGTANKIPEGAHHGAKVKSTIEDVHREAMKMRPSLRMHHVQEQAKEMAMADRARLLEDVKKHPLKWFSAR